MFRTFVHQAVQKVIDGMMDAKGHRALSELEGKPVLKNLFEE